MYMYATTYIVYLYIHVYTHTNVHTVLCTCTCTCGISLCLMTRQRFSPLLADWNTLTALFSICPVWSMCLRLGKPGKWTSNLTPWQRPLTRFSGSTGNGKCDRGSSLCMCVCVCVWMYGWWAFKWVEHMYNVHVQCMGAKNLAVWEYTYTYMYTVYVHAHAHCTVYM